MFVVMLIEIILSNLLMLILKDLVSKEKSDLLLILSSFILGPLGHAGQSPQTSPLKHKNKDVC